MADVGRVFGPGDMGSGIGLVLHGHGMYILTCLPVETGSSPRDPVFAMSPTP